MNASTSVRQTQRRFWRYANARSHSAHTLKGDVSLRLTWITMTDKSAGGELLQRSVIRLSHGLASPIAGNIPGEHRLLLAGGGSKHILANQPQ